MTIEMDAAVEPAAKVPAAKVPAGLAARVCRYEDLTAGRGVAVLLPDMTQAAVFRTVDGRLFGVGNLDPATGAHVISRGLTGTRDGAPTVASPMLKHIYDLATGQCVDGPAGPEPYALTVFPVRCDEGVVYIHTTPPIVAGGN